MSPTRQPSHIAHYYFIEKYLIIVEHPGMLVPGNVRHFYNCNTIANQYMLGYYYLKILQKIYILKKLNKARLLNKLAVR